VNANNSFGLYTEENLIRVTLRTMRSHNLPRAIEILRARRFNEVEFGNLTESLIDYIDEAFEPGTAGLFPADVLDKLAVVKAHLAEMFSAVQSWRYERRKDKRVQAIASAEIALAEWCAIPGSFFEPRPA